MAYLPGLPWDPTYSYDTGNTCTYNGFTYKWIPFWRKSNVGKTPVEDEVPFLPWPGASPSTARRVLRGWSLCNWTSPLIPPGPFLYYEDPVRVFERVRGLPDQSVGWYIYPRGGMDGQPKNGLYLAYWRYLMWSNAKGPLTEDDATIEENTAMYGEPREPSCIDIVPKDPNRKIYKKYAEFYGIGGYSLELNSFTKTYYGMHSGTPCGPGKANTEFRLILDGATFFGSVDGSYSLLQIFGKTYHYKYSIRYRNVKTQEEQIQEYTGSVESGPFRDGFGNDIILSPHEDVIPDDCIAFFAGMEITSVTPDFDS